METARVLALCGAHVIMAVLYLAEGETVKESIMREVPNAKLDVMKLDLSSFASIREFASEFNSSNLPLNLLINNAGILAPPFTLSQDKIELQFAINYLGHFLLTNLLLDNMKRTARESRTEGRIINVSSEGHRFAYHEGIRFDKINDSLSYNSFSAYGQSKLANILHANELARRFKEEGVNITANSLHPGSIPTTNIVQPRTLLISILRGFAKLILKSIPQGAATTCYVALHPQGKGVSGEYFADNNISKASTLATDAELAKKLWDFSVNLTRPDALQV